MPPRRSRWSDPVVLAVIVAALIGAAGVIVAAVISNSGSGGITPSISRTPSGLAATSDEVSGPRPTGSRSPSSAAGSSSAQDQTEIAANDAATHSDYVTGGGKAGPAVPGGKRVAVACRVKGLRLPNGNDWWYRLDKPPWNGTYYVSADPFFNGAPTSTPLTNTPFVDDSVATC